MSRRWRGAAMFALVVLVLAACGGDDDAQQPVDVAPQPTVINVGGPTATPLPSPEPEPTAIPAPTAEPTPEATEPPAGPDTAYVGDLAGVEGLTVCVDQDALCINMESLDFEESTIVVDWTPFNFEPSTAAFHAHFFWNSFQTAQAGSNAGAFGVQRGSWELTDQDPWRSTNLSAAAIPNFVTGLCVTVADGNHAVVDPTIDHCLPLPSLLSEQSLGYVGAERRFWEITEVCIVDNGENDYTAIAQFGDGEKSGQLELQWVNPEFGHGLRLTFDDGTLYQGFGWIPTETPAEVLEGFDDAVAESRVSFSMDRTNAPACA